MNPAAEFPLIDKDANIQNNYSQQKVFCHLMFQSVEKVEINLPFAWSESPSVVKGKGNKKLLPNFRSDAINLPELFYLFVKTKTQKKM